jgi:FAD/FMN-containing dehydrogenase
MKTETKRVANWGNFPTVIAKVSEPENASEAIAFVRDNPVLTTRGNGKCYGDAALGSNLLSTVRLNQILSFDGQSGVIECEAGVLLADVLVKIVPKGWFFHVTPGIKSITVGGAVACDVHGKNHPEKGCFSNWLISIQLLREDGAVFLCSRTENPALFWATCGGMGWTGVVLSAKFQLMPLTDTRMRQLSVKTQNLEETLRAFTEHRTWPYAAGWIDCTAHDNGFGSGAVMFAEHIHSEPPMQLDYQVKSAPSVPFFFPSWILSSMISLHNRMVRSSGKGGEKTTSLDAYFYPLDKFRNWNRFYGRSGFVQYQFCMPEEHAYTGINACLEAIRKSVDRPFLCVIKRHGARPAEAVNSFPVEGYSLALDFPMSKGIFDLVKTLDDLVWKFGGKVYLAKDSCSNARMSRIDPGAFGEEKFSSVQKERILQGLK